METIAISKLRAAFVSLLDRVKKTGKPLLITRRGEPIAQAVPPEPPKAPEGDTFGCMVGTMEIVGDVVEPLGEDDWDASA